MKTHLGKFSFSISKNETLIAQRRVSFEEIVETIETGGLIEIIAHPNSKKYPKQEVYMVKFQNYVYVVPAVAEENERVFFKTIIPSRKMTKYYLKEDKDE